jgi:NADPH-dependent glutamate synthase beta subunit-like oxidoreductase
MYVAGWQKRGPSGIIGTNKFDAEETVMQLLSDLSSGEANFPVKEPRGFAAVQPELTRKGVRTTNYADWQRIDQEERRRGEALGKPREKITSIEEMLNLVEKN